MPAQLAASVLGEAVLPATTLGRAQTALDDTAAPTDNSSAHYQAHRCGQDEDERNLGKREYKLI